MDELNHLKDEETIKYRLELFKLARAKLFTTTSVRDRFRASYSQHVEVDLKRLSSIPVMREMESKRAFSIVVHDTIEGRDDTQTLDVYPDDRPTRIIKQYFRTRLGNLIADNASNNSNHIESILADYVDMYVLNVCGCNDVLFGDEHPIRAYKVWTFLI